MKGYSKHGFNDFVVCLGYKGNKIKEYFSNFFLQQSNISFDLSSGKMQVLDSSSEPWKVTLIDTGIDTYTGGRVKRIQKYIPKETFMLTYCDGVADVNIEKLLKFHKTHGKKATLTAVQPDNRFGVIDMDSSGLVKTFREKPPGENAWINGGYFVLEPSIFPYINGDSTIWEREPLESLVAEKELMVFKHNGYWQCMDTLRDKNLLESEWATGHAHWKTW